VEAARETEQKNILYKLAFIIAIALGLFQVGTAYFGVLPAVYQRAVHWGLIGNFIFILGLADVNKRKPWNIVLNVLGIAATTATSVYMYLNYDAIMARMGAPTFFDIYFGALITIFIIVAGYQTLGWPLPTLATLFILYAFLGPYMPGMLRHQGYSFTRLSTFMYLGTEGIYGPAMNVAATYIFLFILIGVFLENTGAGKFFVDLAFSISGRISGGPAQAAVVSSAMMGTISGSGVANVVTTGTFTIPLMKKTGYKPAFAAAVEAVASNGGQILPPVMGAVAFLMAEIIGISYIAVAKAALIPAILYFFAVMAAVYLEAKKLGLKGMKKEELPKTREVLKNGFYYMIPLIVLIVMLFRGFSPLKAGIMAYFITIVLSYVKKETRLGFKDFGKGFWTAAITARSISAACACAGIIIGIVTLTSLGVKMSRMIVGLSGGHLLLALPLTMIVSLVMGMGLPTTAAYLVLAVLGAPALVNMGVGILPAHLFILYFGALSTITPPVALSTYAAAGIADADPIKTGIQAVKLAAVSFIVPYMFVYSPELLLDGSAGQIIWAIITSLIGCIALAASLIGWLKVKLHLLSRILFFAAAISLMQVGIYSDVMGFSLIIIPVAINKWLSGLTIKKTKSA
jgi:TRAP transporter 4TM/12TM fusion protein